MKLMFASVFALLVGCSGAAVTEPSMVETDAEPVAMQDAGVDAPIVTRDAATDAPQEAGAPIHCSGWTEYYVQPGVCLKLSGISNSFQVPEGAPLNCSTPSTVGCLIISTPDVPIRVFLRSDSLNPTLGITEANGSCSQTC